jgi:hypothetical protein
MLNVTVPPNVWQLMKSLCSSEVEWFGIKCYKPCYSKGYTYNMTVCLGEDKKRATPSMTATHATVIGLTAGIEHVGYKLYVDSFFSSSALFDDLHTKTINCCGTVWPNRKGMP